MNRISRFDFPSGKLFAILLLSGFSLSTFCQSSNNDPGNLEVFGYVFATSNTNDFKQYMNETAMFSNVFVIQTWLPDFDEKMEEAVRTRQKAFVSLHELLFESTGVDPNGHDWVLRSNYSQIFQSFRQNHSQYLNGNRVAAFYVADEPYWNGISESDYSTAVNYVKSQFPQIPTFVSFGPADAAIIDGTSTSLTILNGLQNQIPTDWVSYNQYGIVNPAGHATYQQNFTIIKNHMKPAARTFYILDGWLNGSIPQSQMDQVATNYFNLARNDTDAIGLGVFIWDGSTGTRSGIPNSEDMIREHIRIGAAITGKCGVPADVHPLEGMRVGWYRKCRFYSELSYTDGNTNSGYGQLANFGTDESAVFWFFEPDNLEMMVKVLDGCGYNNRFWVFAAAMTDLGYELNVTDTATGTKRTYTNPAGVVSPAIADTNAFPSCNQPLEPLGPAYGEPTAWSSSVGCTASSTTHCFRQGRFKVEVGWYTNNASGSGRTVPYGTDESGLFWFFGQNNWELLVKVLDGCGYNNRYWVFSAATTNVSYDLTVTDTSNGQVWQYSNPNGVTSDAVTDIAAFATCP